jgi:hypothetical protein
MSIRTFSSVRISRNKLQSFKNSTNSVSLSRTMNLEVLVVGGGGAGGNYVGGLGGTVVASNVTIVIGTAYAVTTGAGGIPVSPYSGSYPGSASSFIGGSTSITAAGGSGNAGPGGGGFGAGANGTSSGILGTTYLYAAGGGGGYFSSVHTGGTNGGGTGGIGIGGSGGSASFYGSGGGGNGNGGTPGSGYQGIVVVRHLDGYQRPKTLTGASVSLADGYVIYSFVSTGVIEF